MHNTPKVSIIMASHNGSKTLGLAIRSLQLQTLKNWELIFVDDASSDSTLDFLRRLNDSRIRIFRNNNQIGLSASLNKCLKFVSAPYVARMDSDDVSLPRRLEIQYNYLNNNPEIDLVGCDVLAFDNDLQLKYVCIAPVGTNSIDTTLSRGRSPLFHSGWFGRAAYFRNKIYDKKFTKAQDFEFLLRNFSKSNYGNINQALVAYRVNRPSFNKILITRWFVLKSFWRNYFVKRMYIKYLKSSFFTIGLMLIDLIRLPLVRMFGLRIMLSPTKPIDQGLESEWYHFLKLIK